MLKCQFHCHCKGDPVDAVNYSPEKLINEAARLRYEVLAITCHRKIIFNEKLKQYAKNKGILLIPGIEFEINGKHILGINIDEKILEVDTFEKLKNYRTATPDCLIIAPHPFFPSGFSLENDLSANIDLFDAIEISWAYTKWKNYNHKAIELAGSHKKPLIATADCHIFSFLNIGYCLMESQKNTVSIINAAKTGKIQNFSKPTNLSKILRFFLQISWQNLLKKFPGG